MKGRGYIVIKKMRWRSRMNRNFRRKCKWKVEQNELKEKEDREVLEKRRWTMKRMPQKRKE